MTTSGGEGGTSGPRSFLQSADLELHLSMLYSIAIAMSSSQDEPTGPLESHHNMPETWAWSEGLNLGIYLPPCGAVDFDRTIVLAGAKSRLEIIGHHLTGLV